MAKGKNTGLFSGGFYEKFWGRRSGEKEDKTFSEDVLRFLRADRGHILDWCGGWGRISLHFARSGFKVTILDSSGRYLKKAMKNFRGAGYEAEVINADFRETPQAIQADYAVCLFCSMGFYDDAEQVKAFKSLFAALKPGAVFAADCMNREYIEKHFLAVSEAKGRGGRVFRQVNNFNSGNGVLSARFEIVNSRGKREEARDFWQRIYRRDELAYMLEAAGFRVEKIAGDFDSNPASGSKPQLVARAVKPK